MTASIDYQRNGRKHLMVLEIAEGERAEGLRKKQTQTNVIIIIIITYTA
jgi:hypothetical protein